MLLLPLLLPLLLLLLLLPLLLLLLRAGALLGGEPLLLRGVGGERGLELRRVGHEGVVVHAAAVEDVHRVRARAAPGGIEAADALEAADLLRIRIRVRVGVRVSARVRDWARVWASVRVKVRVSE